jgi:hypothetical protein
MNRVAACFCALLLIIGTVSAVSLNPAAVPALKTITTTKAPLSMTHAVPASLTVGQQDVFIPVHIQSDPAIADVTVDGADTPLGKTPITIALRPGSHTLLVTHTGYRQKTTTVVITAGMAEPYITATLERLVVQGSSQVIVSLNGIPQTMDSLAGSPLTIATPPHLKTTFTPVSQSCPSTGWTCIPLAQAAAQFGDLYAQYGNGPCGYTANGSQIVPEYCCREIPGGSLSPGSFAVGGIQKTDPGLHIINRTRVLAATNGSVPVKPLGTLVLPRQDFISSFVGFFAGIFAQPVSCPVGTTPCGGGCRDINTDWENCGVCGMTCFDPAVCCGGECIDLNLDESNCGSCGMTCFDPAVCCYGSCENSCDIAGILVVPSETPLELVVPSQTPRELAVPSQTPGVLVAVTT